MNSIEWVRDAVPGGGGDKRGPPEAAYGAGAPGRPRASARRGRTSPARHSSLRSSSSSARVCPAVTMAIGLPSCLACRARRKAENTERELPTSSPSPARTISSRASFRPRGRLSPKNTTWGLSTPPHTWQPGTSKLSTSSWSSSVSPSGRVCPPRPAAACGSPARAQQAVLAGPLGPSHLLGQHVRGLRVQDGQPLLELRAGARGAAAQADGVMRATVDLEHAAAPCAVVQPVHVLGEQGRADGAGGL